MALSSTTPRDDELAALLAAAPPRRVPRRWRRAVTGEAAPLAVAIFGLFFGGIGAVLAWTFIPWTYYHDWRLRARDTVQAPGQIVAAEETGSSINDDHIWRYRFTAAAGPAPIEGTCYTTGRRWSAGDRVTVNYRPENPSIACPLGARTSTGSLASSFVLLFPAVGLGMFAWVAYRRRRAAQLLRDGHLAEAIVVAIDGTHMSINYQPVYKVTLQRMQDGTAHPMTIRCWRPALVTFVESRAATRQPVFVLYDPANSKRVLLPETLLP